jgi:hypothetical protein
MSTIDPDDRFDDPLDDEVGRLLTQIKSPDMRPEERSILKKLADTKIREFSHIEFTGNAENFGLSRVWTSLIYWVPPNKRGSLASYRGQVIRVICVGSGKYSKRKYIATRFPSA